jgi:myo-inositol 2-dehydrogenase / D-chiro-inositol 1-dehydrogenase
MIYAAYESAHTGKKVELPFSAKVSKPVDRWLEK